MVGTDTAAGIVPASSTTVTYWPGQSVWSSFGTVALAASVPEAVSTVESTKSSRPLPTGASEAAARISTLGAVPADVSA